MILSLSEHRAGLTGRPRTCRINGKRVSQTLHDRVSEAAARQDCFMTIRTRTGFRYLKSCHVNPEHVRLIADIRLTV